MTEEDQADTYVSPLRRAVVELLTYDSGWTAEQAAAIAGTDVRAARSFCSRLFNSEVLAKTGAGKYLRGPFAQKWIDTPTRTNPGGRSRRYQASKRLRDQKASDDWHQGMGHQVEQEQGTTCADGIPLVQGVNGEENLTVGQVAKWLNVHRNSVLRWIKSGRLPAVRLIGGSYRVKRQDVLDTLEPAHGQE